MARFYVTTIAAAVLVLLAASGARAEDTAAAFAKARCHNITGTCLHHGFVCSNEEVVDHAKRCDGHEDCRDGTDEFMCGEELTSPLHERSSEQRQAFAQATCVHCNCAANTLTINQGDSWYDFALHAPVDYYGLGTGDPFAYGGRNCNPPCTKRIKMTFYRKTGVCRGYLCCARQNQCIECFSGGACPNFNNPGFFKRCYSG